MTQHPTAVNIGGGPEFQRAGWLNLEAAPSALNPNPFPLTEDCRFPLSDSSVELVFTSHCLEHLDTATVVRVLAESFRVLKQGGDLVIVIPDFEEALAAWRERNEEYFSTEYWGFDAVTPTWKNRNIQDCLDYRAAMVFCGFWNQEYGDHFSRNIGTNENAYHGPFPGQISYLRELIKQDSPKAITKSLRDNVIRSEPTFKFNHRNAWSRKELDELLSQQGFTVKTFSKSEVTARMVAASLDADQRKSMFCWARKVAV